MSLDLRIYYRGPLSGCNYDCAYCPFAKRRDDREALAHDATSLDRFVKWVGSRASDHLRVLFTPWGEAMVHGHYREALVDLSHMPQVRCVAVQTNLSTSTAWLEAADREALALWCTYHPSQVLRGKFLARCRELDALGVSYTVGMVGLRSDLDEIEAVRAALPEERYLWVNANKHAPYEAGDVERLTRVDPLFVLNTRRHHSKGRACEAGHKAISVDGDGVVRRCHFVREPIGNLYDGSFPGCLGARLCPNDSCGCYIGYSNLPSLGLQAIYGDGVLARMPLAHALDVAAAERALESFERSGADLSLDAPRRWHLPLARHGRETARDDPQQPR